MSGVFADVKVVQGGVKRSTITLGSEGQRADQRETGGERAGTCGGLEGGWL